MTERTILRLFEEHHRPLFRFAYRLTGSVPEAEDIVQECFLALLRPDCRFDESRAPVRTYLFGAVRHQALKRLARRDAPVEDAAEPVDHRSPEDYVAEIEQAASVSEAVMRLPATQREVLLLAHYEQQPLSEIAVALGIDLGAVKSRLQRARATLRISLGAMAPEMEKRQ